MRLKDCLEKIIDNRGKNPKYYEKEKYPVIDNVMIKNNFHPNINEATRFINQETHDNFLRGYLESNLPIMTLVGGGIGNVSLSVDDKSVIVQNTIGFKTKPEILDSIYLYYWFLYKHNELIQFNRGSGQPSIKKTDVENMNIDLKDINYQKKVSKILSNIDKKIELNNKLNNNLYDIAKLYYEYYFKNYEFTNDFFEDKFGKIPKGFERKKLSDVTINNREKVGQDKEYKVLSAVKTGSLELSEEFFSKQVPSDELNKYIKVGKDDFAYNPARINIGSIGRNLWDFKCCVSPVYVSFSIDKKYKYFFDFYFKDRKFKDEVLLRASGSVRQTLKYEDFGLIEIIYPSEEIIDKFNYLCNCVFKNIKKRKEENKNLEQLRDILLLKLMNGEINLDNIEI